MRLDPGPIPVLTDPGYGKPDAEGPGLADFATGQVSELEGLDGEMDSHLDINGLIDQALADDGSQELLDYAGAIFSQGNDRLDAIDVEAVDRSAAVTDEALEYTYGVIPAEAWSPVPNAMDFQGGPETPQGPNPTDSTLENLTHPGETDFTVGDEYQFNIRVNPSQGGGGVFANVTVESDFFKNDAPAPHVTLGTTDQFGRLTYKSSWGPDDVGKWGTTLYFTTPDGVQVAGQTLFWEVKPASSTTPGGTTPKTPTTTPTAPPQQPGPGQGVTVTLINTSSPGARDFHVGEVWILYVVGPPFSPVVISGVHDGQPLAPVVLGQTDGTGVFQLGGAMSDAELGQWIERYNVGPVFWLGTLEFAVTP